MTVYNSIEISYNRNQQKLSVSLSELRTEMREKSWFMFVLPSLLKMHNLPGTDSYNMLPFP